MKVEQPGMVERAEAAASRRFPPEALAKPDGAFLRPMRAGFLWGYVIGWSAARRLARRKAMAVRP